MVIISGINNSNLERKTLNYLEGLKDQQDLIYTRIQMLEEWEKFSK
jgi:hypothetical protein